MSNLATDPLITLTAAAAGTFLSADLPNSEWRGIILGIHFSTVTTASVVVTIQGNDPTIGYYDILSSPAIVAAGDSQLVVYPGVAAATNVAANEPLPVAWRVKVVITGASAAVTGKIGASLIV